MAHGKSRITRLFPQSWQRGFWLGLLCLTAFLLVWAVTWFNRSPAYQFLEHQAFTLGERYERWFSQQSFQHPLALMGLSFAGGLVASVSPCILSLLPVNLGYIGTREITNRKDAFLKAGAFVLGVVTVLSLLGLFSAFAGIVLVKFRGYFHLVVGALILLMGMSLAGMVRLPLPTNLLGRTPDTRPPSDHTNWRNTIQGQLKSILVGPYGVGLTFALVSSPCTSPILFAVLAAAATTGSQLQSTLAMTCYALGYTALIFLASLFTGLAKQTRLLLPHADQITRIASLILMLVGAFYLVNGARWILANLLLSP